MNTRRGFLRSLLGLPVLLLAPLGCGKRIELEPEKVSASCPCEGKAGWKHGKYACMGPMQVWSGVETVTAKRES